MEAIKHDIALRMAKMLDIVLMTVPFALAWLFYYADRTWAPFYFKGDWAVIGLFLFLYAVFGKVYDAFLVSLNQMFEAVYSQSLAALFSDVVMYVVGWLLTKRLPNPVSGISCNDMVPACKQMVFQCISAKKIRSYL